MKKLNVLLSAFVFVVALSAAFVTNANQRGVVAKNKFNPAGWLSGQCNSSQTVDQTACPGGTQLCTIGGSSPVYPSAADCRNGTKVMKFN